MHLLLFCCSFLKKWVKFNKQQKIKENYDNRENFETTYTRENKKEIEAIQKIKLHPEFQNAKN